MTSDDRAIAKEVLQLQIVYAHLIIVCALFSFFGHDQGIWLDCIDMDLENNGNFYWKPLSKEKRVQVVKCLVEGTSIRATAKITGVAKNTITKLLFDLGSACQEYQNQHLTRLDCKRLKCDEIWSFCPEKFEGIFGYGDVWTWTAICPENKLVFSWLVANRTLEAARIFMDDVASRLNHCAQLTIDELNSYLEAIDGSFGTHSIAERNNLTMRMSMRRFTRLTSGFSEKVKNLEMSVALHFMYYNFARIHQTLRVTPAMEAGVTDHVWSVVDIVGLLDGNKFGVVGQFEKR